jgi:hypothetical protein
MTTRFRGEWYEILDVWTNTTPAEIHSKYRVLKENYTLAGDLYKLEWVSKHQTDDTFQRANLQVAG